MGFNREYGTIDEFEDMTLWEELSTRGLLGNAHINLVTQDFFERFGNIVSALPIDELDKTLKEIETKFNVKA